MFLWNRLPVHLTGAPVLTQNPEYHQKAHYGIDELTTTLLYHNGWLPAEWEWACSLDHVVRVENCGIMGGQDAAFLAHYAMTALALVECEANQSALRNLSVGFWHNCAIEQFMLAACIGFHAARSELALPRRSGGSSVPVMEQSRRREITQPVSATPI